MNDLGTARVLLTGATGFLGQAVLERLLSSHPETTILLVIRAKGSLTAERRLQALLRKRVFARWRREVGDAEASKLIADRVRLIDGGLGQSPYPEPLDVVIHSASSVTFDAPIDLAFESNVAGPVALYRSLAESGVAPHVVHVSTAYVHGARKGVATEASVGHAVDWRSELAAAAAARERVELDSRRSSRLQMFTAQGRAEAGKASPLAAAEATERARQKWIDEQLVEYGRARAQSTGWTDVYTLTKALGERVAEDLWGEHRLTILRPSIIESALRHPEPGWIDGFKVADPLIVAFGRGQLPEFPGLPDSVLDIVPVDLVVNAAIAAAAAPRATGQTEYIQVASGSSNPLPFHRMYENVHSYFTEHPVSKDGRAVRLPRWRFPGTERFMRDLDRKQTLVALAERAVSHAPATPFVLRRLDRLHELRSGLRALSRLSGLYAPYVSAETIFADDHARALSSELSAESGFDVTDIDWEHYLQEIHLPSIATLARLSGRSERTSRPRGAEALREGEDIVAVFDLEGTTLGVNLVTQYLWARQRGWSALGLPRELTRLVTALPRYLSAERRDRAEFVRAILRLYKGMSSSALEARVLSSLGRRLQSHFFAEAISRATAHKAAGHRTVLVTGSSEVIAQAARPFFDEIYGTRLDTRDGRFTGYLAAPPLVGESRAAWLRSYARKSGFDLARSYGYGDSSADRSWLSLLGSPSAVNPDAELYRYARKHQWDVTMWSARGPATRVAEESTVSHGL